MIGKACIGCGFCCRKGPCSYGVFDPITYCKHLFWDGQRWRCHLIAMSPPHAKVLSAGEGCCCGFNTYQRENRVPTPEEVEEARKADTTFHELPLRFRR